MVEEEQREASRDKMAQPMLRIWAYTHRTIFTTPDPLQNHLGSILEILIGESHSGKLSPGFETPA